jgi:lysophospholipase L1-like esterase
MFNAPSRVRLIAGLAVLLTAGSVAGTSLPAAAHTGHRHALTYVALGDSYAAGQAVDCTHTASSYPLRLDALRRIRLVRDVACAGATTDAVRRAQVGALKPRVQLVTVTVGANDLDLTGVAAVCVPAPASAACASAAQARQALLPVLYRHLVKTYRAIAHRAPHAKILVTGYPALVAAGPVATAEAALNATIARAVDRVADCGVRIRFVPVDFKGHTLEAGPASWFVLTGPNAFHPNAAGDAAIARALAAAV